MADREYTVERASQRIASPGRAASFGAAFSFAIFATDILTHRRTLAVLNKTDMKANELRAGNWVQRNEKQYRCVSDTIVLFDNGQIELKPIPLTEEWLLRFGFRKSEGRFGNQYHIDYFGIYTDVRGKYCFCFDALIKSVEFVHDLQNLFFALTGQELTIKEAAR